MSRGKRFRTRRHRRADKMKMRFGGGKRGHKRQSGRTGQIRQKQLRQNSVRA